MNNDPPDRTDQTGQAPAASSSALTWLGILLFVPGAWMSFAVLGSLGEKSTDIFGIGFLLFFSGPLTFFGLVLAWKGSCRSREKIDAMVLGLMLTVVVFGTFIALFGKSSSDLEDVRTRYAEHQTERKKERGSASTAYERFVDKKDLERARAGDAESQCHVGRAMRANAATGPSAYLDNLDIAIEWFNKAGVQGLACGKEVAATYAAKADFLGQSDIALAYQWHRIAVQSGYKDSESAARRLNGMLSSEVVAEQDRLAKVWCSVAGRCNAAR